MPQIKTPAAEICRGSQRHPSIRRRAVADPRDRFCVDGHELAGQHRIGASIPAGQ
jgi:hypothetical protein